MRQQSSGQRHDGVAPDGGFLMCAPGDACGAADDLAGRRAVVLGASGSIGGAIVDRLLRVGVHVMVVDRDAHRLAADVGRAADVVAGPLERRGDGGRLARRVLDRAGPVDLIVRQYALPTDTDILDLDEHGFDEVFNPGQPYFFLRELLRPVATAPVAERRPAPSRRRVVLVGPAFGDPFEQGEPHVRARGACHSLNGILAAESAAGIRANMIDSGWILEDGRAPVSPQIRTMWEETGGDPASPDDVARLAMCLLSDACTGQVTGGVWEPRRGRTRQPA